MNRTACRRRDRLGFTLIELCVGLGISAALLGQAVPALSRMQQGQRLRGVAAVPASDLQLARSGPVRIGHPVSFRISGKGTNA